MENRPVFRALNKPMNILGVERRLFFFILVVAFLIFHFSDSAIPALAFFGVLLVAARGITQADPQLLRILLNSTRFAGRYDPAIRTAKGSSRG